MNFASAQFFIFFVGVFFIYWHLNRKQQNIFLLCASWFFYACWDWRFLGLIIISTLSNYICGNLIHKSSSRFHKKQWLLISIIINIGILAYFKYANFFVESFITLSQHAGFNFSEVTLNITLPVGISFYIFQSLSYSLDIYRKQLTPNHSLLDFATFVSFFPQLVAGPIVRAKEFLYQLEMERKFTLANFETGCIRFLIGLFKKVFIADNLAIYLVDPVFQNPDQYSSSILWLAMFGYAVQIYADFSGYSNMAIGTARMLGFQLPENFKFPYLATNFSEFWQRWHTTMSRFFRDYVYIPLGGNRKSKPRTLINLATTTLISGLWHGANWTFVVWGGLHGTFIAIQHAMENTLPKTYTTLSSKFRSINILCQWLITHICVCIAWVLFRASDFNTAEKYLSGLIHSNGNQELILPGIIWLCFTAFILDHIYGWNEEHMKIKKQNVSPVIYAGLYVVMLCAVFYGKPEGANPFIYFQF